MTHFIPKFSAGLLSEEMLWFRIEFDVIFRGFVIAKALQMKRKPLKTAHHTALRTAYGVGGEKNNEGPTKVEILKCACYLALKRHLLS